MEPQIRYYSQFFRPSYHGPPPQISSSWKPASEAFQLPTYDQVMMTAEFSDSNRLPNYQSRHLLRYHPYWQYKPPRSQTDGLKFQDTIFDEQYVPLEVPARVGPPRPTQPLTPWGIVPLPQPTEDEFPDEALFDSNPVEYARQLREIEERRWARVWPRRAVLMDFYMIMERVNSERRGTPRVIPRFESMPGL